jgi:enamine deaminase RidA (YjgF/YER057c/UK114 family)
LRIVSAGARQIASRMSKMAALAGSEDQTRGLFEELRRLLHAIGLELSDRTQFIFSGSSVAEDVTLPPSFIRF